MRKKPSSELLDKSRLFIDKHNVDLNALTTLLSRAAGIEFMSRAGQLTTKRISLARNIDTPVSVSLENKDRPFYLSHINKTELIEGDSFHFSHSAFTAWCQQASINSLQGHNYLIINPYSYYIRRNCSLLRIIYKISPSGASFRFQPSFQFGAREGHAFNILDFLHRVGDKFYFKIEEDEIASLEDVPLEKHLQDACRKGGDFSAKIEDIMENVSTMQPAPTHYTLPHMLKLLSDNSSSLMERLLERLSTRAKVERLNTLQYPLEDIIIRRNQIGVINTPTTSKHCLYSPVTITAPTLACGFNGPKQELLDFINTVKTGNMSITLLFSMPDIHIYSNNTVTYDNGILVGDFLLHVRLQASDAEDLQISLRLSPQPSHKDSVIAAYLEKGSVTINSFDSEMYLHPHVATTGILCLGEYEALIKKEILRGNFHSVPALVGMLLENINPFSVFINIANLLLFSTNISEKNFIAYISGNTKIGLSNKAFLECLLERGSNLDMEKIHKDLLVSGEEKIAIDLAKTCADLGYKIVEPEEVEDEKEILPETRTLVDLLVTTPILGENP